MTELIDDGFDVRETLLRSRELMSALAQENEELGQLIGQARTLLQALELALSRTAEPEEDVDMRERMATQRNEIALLRARLAQYENARARERRRLLEHQHQALMALHVATQELLAAQEPEQIYAVIIDVVVNLIGCEEAAIYRLDERGEGRPLVLCMAIGLAAEPRLASTAGMIGQVIESGEPRFPGAALEGGAHGEPARERSISACVPLRFGDRTIGVLVLHRLLGHKSEGLTAIDQRVLTALAGHAGLALEVANMRVESE